VGWTDRHRRRRRDSAAGPGPRPGDGVSELRALPAHDGTGEPGVRLEGTPREPCRRRAEGRRRGAGARDRDPAGAPAIAALGWTAAARRARPRDGAAAKGLPAG